MTEHDAAYLDACARKLDASLGPILDQFSAETGTTAADYRAALVVPAAAPSATPQTANTTSRSHRTTETNDLGRKDS